MGKNIAIVAAAALLLLSVNGCQTTPDDTPRAPFATVRTLLARPRVSFARVLTFLARV